MFQITPASAVAVLHLFSASTTEGAAPVAGLAQGSDGNFYGTTTIGGMHYQGTVFTIDSTGNLTTLHSFSGSPNEGAGPFADLMQGSDGNFYGTTTAGGAHYQGTNLQPFVYRCACALEIALKRRAKLRDASLTCRLCKALGICMIRAPLNQ